MSLFLCLSFLCFHFVARTSVRVYHRPKSLTGLLFINWMKLHQDAITGYSAPYKNKQRQTLRQSN